MDSSRGHVYLVDDSSQVQSHMGELLRRYGYEVQGFTCAESFLALPVVTMPAVLVLDMRLPGASGVQLQRQLRAAGRHTPIVFISGEGMTHEVIDGFRAGAIDFLWKPFPVSELLAAIDRGLAADLGNAQRQQRESRLARRLERLTPREREFMLLMVDGHTNKGIGEITGVAADTVKKYRAQILEKMGVESLPELIVLCRDTSLFEGRTANGHAGD